MGLSPSAYKNIKLLKACNDDWEDEDIDSFSGKKNILLRPKGEFPTEKGIVLGYYEFTEDFCFSAGAYSGHNEWRRELARMVGYPDLEETIWKFPEKHKDNPFFELLWFSDCEGVLNAETCKELYNDFLNFEETMEKFETNCYHWKEKYYNFKKAFEFGKENGAVLFS